MNSRKAIFPLVFVVLAMLGFGPAQSFYSRTNGSWSTPGTWSNTGHGGAAATTVPGASDIVFIGDGISYNHTVTVTAGTALSSTLTLQQGSVLDLGNTTGNNFGTVTNGSNGTLRISSGSGTAVFPAGSFSNFMGSSGGTVEYYTTGTQNFTLPTTTAAPTSASITSYCYLKLTPGTGREITMPNSNLTIYRNFVISGTSATGLVKLNNASLSTLTVNGHLTITSGNLQFQNTNNKALTMVVDSNVTIAAGALFNLGTTGPGADNTLSIGGNLVNNGTFDMSYSQAQRAYPVIFTGGSDASISGTGSVTDFYALTVNKGTSATPVLNVNSSAFSFSNTIDPLIMVNGTFRLTSAVSVTVSENSLTLPATTCLSANGGTILASTASNNLADVKLGGKIEVIAGGITIGNAANNVNNDIIYDSVGFPTIDIQNGSLFVNGQVMRSAVNGSGSLVYNQAGSSTVTINGRNQLSSKSKLEILNSGSVFNMSAGTLTIVRGAGTTFSDLYLHPASSSITGGTVIFGNSSTETTGQANVFTIDANVSLNNLTIDGTTNPKTVTVAASGLTLVGVLLCNGTFNANGNIKLMSTATQTALIDGAGTGQVLGNITLQRYLPSGYGYKYFSSPFEATTVSQFASYVDLTASFPTFYRYDENRDTTSGWVNYTNSAGLLSPGYGYAANFGDLPPAVTVELTGVVNNSTMGPETIYNHNNTYTLGFNLIGNPYPSPIDWDAIAGWTRTNIDNAVYYFNAGSTDQYTGTYSTYINGISSDGVANNIIPAMQGFFIHVSDGSYPVSGTLTFRNAVRSNNLSPVFHKMAAEDTVLYMRLAAGFSDRLGVFDNTVLYFDQSATKGFDKERDALKLMNTDISVPNLYSLSADTRQLSINAMPFLIDSVNVIPLGIKTEQNGWVTIKSVETNKFPAEVFVYLNDKITGKFHNLLTDQGYRVYLEAGQYENRFYIVFSLKALYDQTGEGHIFNAYASENKIYVFRNMDPKIPGEMRVYNMLGNVIIKQSIPANGDYVFEMNVCAGVYIISLHSGDEIQSKKVFLTGKQ